MKNLSRDKAGRAASAGTGGRGAPVQPGVVGIALAALLTFALAQGSWQWFATHIGVTLLVMVFPFYRPPMWVPELRSSYVQGLTAYALTMGCAWRSRWLRRCSAGRGCFR